MQNPSNPSPAVSRRQFIKTSTLAAATTAAAASFPYVLRAQGKQAINAVIIGIGGRGGGAGQNFLEAGKNLGVDTKIVAVADLFPEQAKRGTENFSVPEEKCFSGFDAFRKALEVPGVNYAILATPPGFRASHFRACVEAGKNVFMEKPVAVDGSGCRLVYETAEMAKQKNLKVAAGTQRRHQASYNETIKRIHDGAIGDIVAARCYWNGDTPWRNPRREGQTDMEYQLRNWYHYTWLCGDHIVEQHVHNLDVMNWVLQGHPLRAVAVGGKQVRTGPEYGNGWDHFGVDFEWPNDVHVLSMCRHWPGTPGNVSEAVVGTKGKSNCATRITGPNEWSFQGGDNKPYVQEHTDLIASIRSGNPLNEAEQVAHSTLTAIMGREAAYTGQIGRAH